MIFKTMTLVSAWILPVAAMAQTSMAATDSAAPAQESPAASSSATAPSGPSTTQVNGTQTEAPGATVVATAGDVKVGAVVKDPAGQNVGTIESVADAGAVVTTGQSRAQIPLDAFAKRDGALVIGMTKAELDAAVAKQKPSS